MIRKASAHGLGHLLPPYVDPDPASRASRIAKIKVDLWQEDLWAKIIEETLRGDAGALDLEADPRLAAPAAKEADHLEEVLGRSEDDESENEIGLTLVDRVRLVAVILAAKKRFGVRALRRAAGVSDHTISKAISGFAIVPDRTLNASAEGAAILEARPRQGRKR